ncbi:MULTISPECIES: nitrogenase component 1 [unclassified Paenibacillus]|uniref:nitrogenase component 1 n=1 Tax=unclassified Paenibacillus TaxID=185978 RepID=UPI002406CDD1|nr:MULTISPECIES: nitrogenase component 1 [unclassified Paenibacillus]MDF9844565.1 nitrogenase molybdenum-iron protein beta chain [Paenibacillus sp. PastF-2]MDF9851150.1 nitrogenase molybdenum-iron protein beta chain [Paenibacillus sp. PastM-2]MDF9856215.1 nitrogenase molybdenum-iron protein beta chain [Paenibacillus sp. PastF-1]MDH6481556.1 nitrogenase molybdenum-iron protein beta chain [Paenibacillus sp. PastH-2]MDH6510430.1 nitrogenase molybdenum-iron protein beta chain [Paenibacillus sp. Pa
MGAAIALGRNSCLLHGAVQTIKSIEGAVPIIHSTAGCGVQQYIGVSSLSGNAGSGRTGGLGLPSTNVLERQVVFGGNSRLREQLKNTVKIKEGDFYVVLTGCTPELVGDDVPAMTKELQDQFYKAIHVSAPGFKGSVHSGYTAAVTGILRQLDKLAEPEAGKRDRLVNLFGIIPEQDVFWQGNLQALQADLEGAGAEVNVLLGPGSGLGEWSAVCTAALNLSFSPHSLEICRLLEEQYGIPYVHTDGYPVGAEQTAGLLRTAAGSLNLDAERLESWIALKEREERYYIVKSLDAYYRYGFQRKTVLVGDSGFVLGAARFLDRPLGLPALTVVITDDLPAAAQSDIRRRWAEAGNSAETEIVFAGDAAVIDNLLARSGAELVLGSSLEQAAARRLEIPFLPVSFPVADRLVLNKSYAGSCGGLALLQDLGDAIIAAASRRLSAPATNQ